MKVAEIILNYPHCPKCGQVLSFESIALDVVKVNEETYYQFTRRCLKCGEIYRYQIDTKFEKRYNFERVIITG